MASILPPEDTERLGLEVREMYQQAMLEAKAVCAKLDRISASDKQAALQSDSVGAWLLHERPLTFWERCKVGYRLWADGVARFPWPVKQNKEFL